MPDLTSPLPQSTIAPGAQLGLAAGVLVWFATIATLATHGAFVTAPGDPPLALAVAALLPPAVFLAALSASPGLHARIAALDPALVIGAQSWRMLGIAFLFVWAAGGLPAVFALPAGLGDAGVAVAALLVARAAAGSRPGWERRARRLIAAGLVDFAAAFAAAMLSGAGSLLNLPGAPSSALVQQAPYVLIPAFGVPVFLLLHVASWVGLRSAEKRAHLSS